MCDNPLDAANDDSAHLPSSLDALLASFDLQHMKNCEYFRYVGSWGSSTMSVKSG